MLVRGRGFPRNNSVGNDVGRDVEPGVGALPALPPLFAFALALPTFPILPLAVG